MLSHFSTNTVRCCVVILFIYLFFKVKHKNCRELNITYHVIPTYHSDSSKVLNPKTTIYCSIISKTCLFIHKYILKLTSCSFTNISVATNPSCTALWSKLTSWEWFMLMPTITKGITVITHKSQHCSCNISTFMNMMSTLVC